MTSSAATVPTSVDAVTPQWLTDALRSDPTVAATATVTGVRAERIAEDTGFSALLYRLHLSGSADLPATLIAKLPAQNEARGAMEMLSGYRRELSFYRDVAGTAPIATPRCYAAQLAEPSADGQDFILLLEDLQAWDNADHLAGLSMQRTRLCIEQLAGLHAWSVTSASPAVLQEFPSLDTAIAREIFLPVFTHGWNLYTEKSSVPVPPAVARFAEHFAELAPAALGALTERSMLLHGDIRADNMFFDGDQLKVVDFQMAARGAGVADIAYLVSQGLPTELRSGHDEALVRLYLEHLARVGVTDYSFDEAWRHYRFGVAYLMFLPVLALLGWDAMPERSRKLCVTLTDRAVATIDEIDALEVFA